jgi:hypothetical protein
MVGSAGHVKVFSMTFDAIIHSFAQSDTVPVEAISHAAAARNSRNAA